MLVFFVIKNKVISDKKIIGVLHEENCTVSQSEF